MNATRWWRLLLLLAGAMRVAALPCSSGTYEDGQACPSCPPGTFCPGGVTLPLPCPIGFACPGFGLSFPQLCGGQSYCPESSLTSPLPCPTGNMSTPGALGCVAAVVSTLAGMSTLAGSTPNFADGSGNVAAFYRPSGVAVNASGNFLVADTNNHRVRRVTPSGGTRQRGGWKMCLRVSFVVIRCFANVC